MFLRGHRAKSGARGFHGALATVRPLQVLAARQLHWPPYQGP